MHLRDVVSWVELLEIGAGNRPIDAAGLRRVDLGEGTEETMGWGKKQDGRSPIKRDPLRQPGQSVQEEIDRLIDDKLHTYVVAGAIFILVAGLEWLRWFRPSDPQPKTMTAIALLVVGYCTFRFFRLRKQLAQLKQGRDGEKVVGQYLEDLRAQGCRVFHDIVGETFNIDHVIVSPQGIFTIETKTHIKPWRGRTEIDYDGERVRLNGHEPERNPVQQALAQRDWLCDLLKGTTGRLFPIRAAILYPGWFVKPNPAISKKAPWVLNPEMLPAFILKQPEVLKREDVALVSSRIIDHMTRPRP